MPLILTLSPPAGRGDFGSAARPFSPPAGRRSRQRDEGPNPQLPARKTQSRITATSFSEPRRGHAGACRCARAGRSRAVAPAGRG
ncbi:hypothetical protein EHS39_07025 [Ensifer sp. MPMI2T]|nr:hypothetical protein EHS39_07025 [Ensifer sp. MPMI2T]